MGTLPTFESQRLLADFYWMILMEMMIFLAQSQRQSEEC
jgi:hypothetical protein